MVRWIVLLWVATFCAFHSVYGQHPDDHVSSEDVSKLRYHLEQANQFMKMSNYASASKHLTKAIELAEHQNNDSILYESHNLMGKVFFYQNNFDKSLSYYTKAVKVAPDKTKARSIYYKLRGDIFLLNELPDSAKRYYQAAERISLSSGKIDSLNLAKLYANYSILMGDDFLKKLDYAFKADAFNFSKEPFHLINKGNIGVAYKQIVAENRIDSLSIISRMVPSSKNENIQLADRYVSEAIALANSNNDIENEAYFRGILAEVQELKGDYKNANYNVRFFYQTMDSIYSQESKNALSEIESQLQLEKKNAEISAQNKLRLALLMVILLLSILGIQLWIRARKRKKTNLLLSHLNDELKRANLVKSKFFSIISHDLRAPISNIISLMQLSKDTSVEEPSLQKHYDKITRDAENLLESMDTMLMWSKGQLDHFKPEKKTVQTSILFDYIRRFFSSEEKIDFQFIIKDAPTLFTDENFMQVIMQNLTSNAVKALKNKSDATIIWTAYVSDNKTCISIKDNGPGMPENVLDDILKGNINSSKTGLGLQIVMDLAYSIGCKVSFKTQNTEGFKAIITI